MKYLSKFIIASALFVSCSSSNDITSESISFKNQAGTTGIYETDPNGPQFSVLDDTVMHRLNISTSINIDRIESLKRSATCRSGEICIDFKLDAQGTNQYTELTKRNIRKEIFYVIDGTIISAPHVMDEIRTGSGKFSFKETYFDSLFVVK